MISYFDQFAYSMLTIIFGLMGTQTVPAENSPDWIIKTPWHESSNQSYKLVLQSTALAQKCKDNPSHYVVFGAVNLSINNVFVDGKLIASNNPMQDWKLSEVFFKPVIHCEFIKGSSTVRQEINSFTKHLGVLTHYPYLQAPSLGFYFFSSDLFYLAALMVFLFSIINLAIIIFSGQIMKLKFSLIQDVSFFLVLLSFSPGKFFAISLVYTNELFLSWLILGVFCIGHISGLVNMKRFAAIATGAILLYLFSIGNKNLIYFMSICLAAPILIWLVVVFWKFFENFKKTKHDRVLYACELILLAVVPICLFIEFYKSNFTFTSFVYLPLIILLVSLVNFLEIIRSIGLQKYEKFMLEAELAKKLSTITELTEAKNVYHEIIHDIKSPLSSLNFILADKAFRENHILLQLKERLSGLLARSEVFLRNEHIGWKNVSFIINFLNDLPLQYAGRITIDCVFKHILCKEVYLDCTGFEVVMAEIVDNCIKANVAQLQLSFGNETSGSLTVSCQIIATNAQSPSNINYGSGKGISYIKQKVEAWGGSMHFDEGNFSTSLQLLAR